MYASLLDQRHAPFCRFAVLSALFCGTLAIVSAANADVFHLKNGGAVEGTLIEQTDTQYRIRAQIGIVTIEIDQVERIEERASQFDDYQARVAEAGDTAAAQFALAQWCQEHKLDDEARRHLARTVELDPGHAEARTALGYVRVGEFWIDGRRVVKRGAAKRGETARALTPEEQAELIREIQGQWNRRIRAIQTNLLESSVDRLVREGAERILEITDPLAIEPMAFVLTAGDRISREILIAALARFSNDEATMNLAVIALVDNIDAIRDAAISELVRRDDPRVIPQFREALLTDNDALVKRAAEALGRLGAESAVPELIGALRVQRVKNIEVPVRGYFDTYSSKFATSTKVFLGRNLVATHTPRIGIAYDGVGLGTYVDTAFERRSVSVMRTEVLDALKQITGQNFGFDQDAWRRWLKEQGE